MICNYQGHSFVAVRTFDSTIHNFTDDKMTTLGTQKFQEIVCQGCGGTVLEEVKNGWTPTEPEVPVEQTAELN